MAFPETPISKNWRWLSLSLLVVFGLSPTFVTQQDAASPSEPNVKPYAEPDAYSIYAVLVESEKNSFFVIRSETESFASATTENIGIEGDRSFQKVWGPVLKSYADQLRTPRLLTRNIPTETAYELVSEQRIHAIFKSERKWEAFYELYPLSHGRYYWFSPVGFDPQKTHAIVRMNHLCGVLCGGGEPHFFEKASGKWHEVSVNATRRVWAS
jgi:hypothetical protein